MMTHDTDLRSCTGDIRSAVEHYYPRRPADLCPRCRRSGLATILVKAVPCAQALLTLARTLGHHHLEEGNTLEMCLAIEHVWGSEVPSDGGSIRIRACTHSACRKIVALWQKVSQSEFYESNGQLTRQIPLTVRIFAEEGFDMREILLLQRERVQKLLRRLGQPKSLPARERESALAELALLIEVLHELALRNSHPIS